MPERHRDPEGPHRCEGLARLAARFELFIVDQFGVIHDGSAPYPGAVECLERLARAGRRVAILSNSGKRAEPNIRRLMKLGIPRSAFSALVSSGETAWQELSTRRDPWFAALGRRCLLLTRGGDRSVIEGLDLAVVSSVGAAEFVLVTGCDAPEMALADYEPILREATARGLPMVCANPDMRGVTANGVTFGPGAVACRYRELGGEVRMIGKPHPEVYRRCLEAIGASTGDRAVAIGDSVEHDVAGGKAAGMATVFVSGGIHAEADEHELAALYRRHGAIPDWIMPAFAW